MKILITGATGNVGRATLEAFGQRENKSDVQVFVATRTKDASASTSTYQSIYFDFAKPQSYTDHIQTFDSILLLRPPQLADTEKYFRPFTEKLQSHQHVAFLSVQGADKMTFVPHHKIQKLLVESKATYTFLQPSYFMQNFLMDLKEDLFERHRIFLPSGKSLFNLIDVVDIGKVAAEVLANPHLHRQKSYEITGSKNYSFADMADIITEKTGVEIRYISPNLVRFFWVKKSQGVTTTKIFVMIMLHYLPRLSKSEPAVSSWVKRITGQEPVSFADYVVRELKGAVV